jgi:hypothetical protein
MIYAAADKCFFLERPVGNSMVTVTTTKELEPEWPRLQMHALDGGQS